MAEFSWSTGLDCWISEASPDASHPKGRFPAVRAGNEIRTLLWLPIKVEDLRGRTVLSATLSWPVQDDWVAQTVTVQAIDDEDWTVDTVTFNNKPGLIGSTATEATGALTAGDSVEVTGAGMIALIQAIADGQPNRGWQITTDQTTDRSSIRGFDSGFASWVLTVEVSDEVDQPAQGAPEGVIGTGTPTLLLEDTDDLAAAQVQIDATPSGINADYDTDWVATTTPQVDMSATFPDGTAAGVGDTVYNGLADAATTSWRYRVRTLNGSESEWSEWFEITRHDKPAIVDDTGTDIFTPTPTFEAHADPAGDADTRWQLLIVDATDPTLIRYDSGDALTGATLSHQVPLTYQGRAVFPVDGDYTRIIKLWDRTDRVPSPGDAPYVIQTDTITLDTDAGITVPDDVAVTQATPGDPGLTVSWTQAVDPAHAFVIHRDGELVHSIDPAEREWLDEDADPNVAHTYAVRAVDDDGGVNKQSVSSATAATTADVSGVRLHSTFGTVVLKGAPVATQVDKRQTFELPYRGENVDIITAIGGYEGTFSGFIVNDGGQDVDEARVILEQLRQAPQTQVRMTWGTQNRQVHLRGLSVAPHAQIITEGNRMHEVAFGFFELEPRD